MTTTVRPGQEPRSGHDETDLVRAYLDEAGRTPLLTASDEVRLAKRIEAGVYADELLRRADADGTEPEHDRRELKAVARDGASAKDHMIRANLRLVVTAARKGRQRDLPLLDAIQEGNLGLIHAVEKFDYAKGFKFSTYAMWWIRQAIQRGNAFQANTIRLPMHTAEQLAKLDRVGRALRAKSDHEPTIEELAAAADLPVERVRALRGTAQATVSLDGPVDDEGELRLGDLVTGGSAPQATDLLEHDAMVADLHAAMETLPPLEATVVAMRYGLRDGNPLNAAEIARRLGKTPRRVRQLEQRALELLRDSKHREPLLEWAG